MGRVASSRLGIAIRQSRTLSFGRVASFIGKQSECIPSSKRTPETLSAKARARGVLGALDRKRSTQPTGRGRLLLARSLGA